MSVTITMASEPYEHLALRQEGDALWVTMNRPDSLNALNRRLTAELRDLFVNLYWRRASWCCPAPDRPSARVST